MFNYLSPRRNYDVSRSLWDELFSPNFFTANSSAMKTDIRETERNTCSMLNYLAITRKMLR